MAQEEIYYYGKGSKRRDDSSAFKWSKTADGKWDSSTKTTDTKIDIAQNTTCKTGSNNYHYYRVDTGINYAGVCNNPKCEAFNEWVICNSGLGKHNVLLDIGKDKIQCQGCQNVFDLRLIFLSNCKTIVSVKKVNDNNVTRLEKEVKGENLWVLGASNIGNDKKENQNNDKEKDNSSNSNVIHFVENTKDYETLEIDCT